MFGTFYFPDDNYDCFSNPFDDDSPSGDHGTAPGWGGPVNPVTGDHGNPNWPENIYNQGFPFYYYYDIAWGAAQTPIKFWNQYQSLNRDDDGNIIWRTCPTGGPTMWGDAYGTIHISRYEGVWE